MKKNWILLLACILMLLSFSGCGKQKQIDVSRLKKADHSSLSEEDLLSVEMDYPDYPLEDPVMYCIFENHTGQELYYGRAQVEVQDQGEWYELPLKEGTAFTLVQYFLPAETRTGLQAGLSIYDFTFAPGHYRLAIPYWTEAGGTEETADYIAFAEFDLVKNPKRIEYQEFVEQSYDVKASSSNGLVFIRNGVEGQENIDRFVDRMLCNVPASMRIIYPDEDVQQHFFYRDGCCIMQQYENRAVTTHCYSLLYFDAEIEEVFLSNYRDPNLARAEGFVVEEPDEIFQIGPTSEENIEQLTKQMQRLAQETCIMKVYLYGEDCSVSLFAMNEGLMLGYDNPAEGEMLGEVYPLDGLHPVDIRAATRTAAIITFKAPDGSKEQRILNAETGEME